MDTRRLRGTLLRLQDRLSAENRHRLHFFLGDDVPRRIRDDSTLTGTLSLMESLFDQDKISENDFTLLIDAFDEIQCHDAAKLLREYRDHLRETDRNGSGRSLAAILPTLIEIDDPLMVGDRRPACELRSIEIADPPVMMVDEEPDCEDRLTEDSPTRRSPVAKPLSLFNVRERDLRIVILIILFLIGLLVLSFVFSFIQWKKNNQERDRTDQCQNKLRDLQVTREPEIPRLSEDLLVKSDEPKPVIKHGKKFGVNLGYSFDDSKAPDFNIGHYFSGLTIRSDTDDLETYEFHYTSDLSSDPIRSIFHGEDMVPMRSIFDFRHRDRITEVQGLLTRKMVQLANGTNSLIVAVTGLRFHSMNGIWSLGFQGPEQGQRFSENFTGYSLGYIKGQADRYLHQIQFVWYRTE